MTALDWLHFRTACWMRVGQALFELRMYTAARWCVQHVIRLLHRSLVARGMEVK